MKRMTLLSLVLLAAALPLSAQTFDCLSSGGTNCTAAIPDPGSVTSTLPIPASCDAINQYPAGFTVAVDLTHTWVGDLTVTLTHPDGVTSSTLVDRPIVAGNCASDDIDGTFSDAGAAFECAATIPANGVPLILPVTPMSVFTSISPTGVWSLEVEDASPSGAGALNNWSLTATCGMEPTVTITTTDANGHESGDTITFVVTRSAIVNSPIEPSVALPVNVTFSGTATAGVDYTSTFPVVIPAGEASVTLTVTPLADALTDPGETVIATVQPGAGYAVGTPNEASGLIQETEAAPIPTLSPLALLLVSLLLAAVAAFVLRGGASA